MGQKKFYPNFVNRDINPFGKIWTMQKKRSLSYLELQHVEVGFGVQPDFPIIGLYKMPGINAMKPNTCDLVTMCVIKQPSTLCIG